MNTISNLLKSINVNNNAITTISNNISNANNINYHRQDTELTNNPLGGVDISNISRAYNQFIENSLFDIDSQVTKNKISADIYSDVETLSSNIDSKNKNTMSALNLEINAILNKTGKTTPNLLLDKYTSVLSNAQQNDTDLTALKNNKALLGNIDINKINSLTDQISKINIELKGDNNNNIQDKKYELMKQLNSIIPISEINNNIYIKNTGAPLVLDVVNNQISYNNGYYINGINIDHELNSSSTYSPIDEAQNARNNDFLILATNVNNTNKNGASESGVQGTNIFNIPTSITRALNSSNTNFNVSINNVNNTNHQSINILYDGSNYQISDSTNSISGTGPLFTFNGYTFDFSASTPVAGDKLTFNPSSDFVQKTTINTSSIIGISNIKDIKKTSSNISNGLITLDQVINNADPNINANVSLSIDPAGTYTVSGTGTTNNSGNTIPANGLLQINGIEYKLTNMSPGDSFTFTNSANSSDRNNLKQLLTLNNNVNQQALNNTQKNGSMLNITNNELSANKQLQTEYQNKQQSISGINLDEEAANLIKYQQALQASQKMFATTNQLWEDFINSIG